ncbi:MAG TPA: response regulator [bacterium]|nr:response regulator [bacterium]
MNPNPLEAEPRILTNAPLRVLSVEDSPTAQVLLRHHLRLLAPACEIFEAMDGRSALKALTSRAVDLIVCDLQMPGMDGASFLQLLRRNSLLRSKPVLVVTGSPDQAGPELVADASVRILSKPLGAEPLSQGLRELLGKALER